MHPDHRRRSGRRRALVGSGLLVAATVLLSGCSDLLWRGFLPGNSAHEVTDQTGRISTLWRGSWIAALLVGILVWGLILWCVAAYRKRKDDDSLPVQLRYHVPLEVMYVVLPIVMIGVMFFFTNRDTTAILATDKPADLHVQVIGKQWSWDINYLDDGVYDAGVQAQDVSQPDGLDNGVITLYLPVNERVQFTINSRDVAHSFWVPAFLFKMDAIPGHTNTFQVTPTAIGTYRGKCAELCGEYHAKMLFNVQVVSKADYDAHIAALRSAGKTGQLGLDFSREQSVTTIGGQG